MNFKQGMEVAPAIIVFEDVIDNCDELISLALSDGNNWRDSFIVMDKSNIVDKSIRNTKILDVPGGYSDDIEWFKISQLIWRYGNEYAINFNIAFSNMEPAQLLHYSTEDGFYRPHADDGPGINRIFSAILYLNDVEEGGETYFNKFDISISPKSGRLVLFPSNYAYVHEAKTPKSGDKFVLVTWFRPVM